jgi:hypothetical protein
MKGRGSRPLWFPGLYPPGMKTPFEKGAQAKGLRSFAIPAGRALTEGFAGSPETIKMGRMKIFLGLTAFLLGITFSLVGPHDVLGAEPVKPFLADRHGAKGIQCNGCHRESPPKTAAPSAVCLQCHGGTYKKTAEWKKAIPNPHLSHQGDLPCESCHHSHKKSENQCGSCHDFDYKIP